MVKSTDNKPLRGTLIFLAFVSSVLILMVTLGDAAWNGVNLVMGLYLLLATLGFLGLLISLIAIGSGKSVFLWVAASSATAIGGLSLLFLGGFLFARTPGVPLMNPLIIAGVPIPLIAYFGFVLVCCTSVVVSSLQKLRNQRTVQSTVL